MIRYEAMIPRRVADRDHRHMRRGRHDRLNRAKRNCRGEIWRRCEAMASTGDVRSWGHLLWG